jgi:hypothetical protein
MRRQNAKFWQSFSKKRTGTIGGTLTTHSASHRAVHALKYRLSRSKEWLMRSTARRTFIRQSGITFITNVFTLPRRPQCALVCSEAPSVGGGLIKKLASFRHKTQKFFFLAGSPLGIFLLTLRFFLLTLQFFFIPQFFLIHHRFADRPTSPIFQNPTHSLLIQCHRYTPPGNKFAWFERVLA